MKKAFFLKRHTTVDFYLYSGQFEKREVFYDPDEVEITNLKKMPILDFDLSELKGQKILGAKLSLKVLTEDYPYEVAVTTINDDWDAQYATNYTGKESTPWANNKWVTDVMMGNGNSVYSRVRTNFDAKTGVLSFDICPKVLYQIVNGQSYGFGLIDCKSRSYMPLNGAIWCGSDVHKKLGVSEKCGFVPVLEIEYEPAEVCEPAAPVSFSAIGIEEPEHFGDTSVVLSWKTLKSCCCSAPFRFYKLYYAELTGKNCDTMPLRAMLPVKRYMIPNFDSEKKLEGTKIELLKPNTEYLFALTVSNGVNTTEPVYAKARTLSARLPLSVQPAAPCSCCKKEGVLKAEGFTVGVTSEIDKIDPVSGKNYFSEKPLNSRGHALVSPTEKIGFQVIVENLTGAPANYTVSIAENNIRSARAGDAIKLYRNWYLKVEENWYPEVAVASCGCFSIPAEDNKVEGQRNQALLVDLTVPADTKPGKNGFVLNISDGKETVSLSFDLQVADVKLLDTDFKVELNGYISLPKCAGYEPGDPDFDEVEVEYYRLAHENGMVNNILPYFHTGVVQDTFAPIVEMKDGVPTVTDWSPWDDHFDKYLSGSYLQGTEHKSTPISHIYLPFHENWPMPINEYYQVENDYTPDDYPENINQNKIRSHSPYEDFKPGYREGIKAILKEFIRHIDEKGYNNVVFQYFFNNKHFYKRKGFVDACKDSHSLEFWLTGPTCGNDGQGTSWWLLDEPHFMDDWDAIAYYGSILREAQAETGSGQNIRFRVDISCYNDLFHSLDGILDIGVCGSTFYNHREDYLRDRRVRHNEDYWVYGSWNSIDKNNLETTLWFIDSYLKGGQGIIPWYNFALDYNYEAPDTCAGVYPGKRFGSKAPFASLRLKAGRKAVELMGYLDTLKHAYGYSDQQLKNYVSDFFRTLGLDLDGKTIKTSDVDAGTVRYEKAADYEALEALKNDIISRLVVANKF